MILLLPPSEGKAMGGEGMWDPSSGRYGSMLDRHRSVICSDLLNHESRPQHARFDTAGCLPAHQRYNGVVWKHLDPASLDPAAAAVARRSVLVVSALGGFFAWDDPVPGYKLKMSASTIATGRLTKYWLPVLSPLLRDTSVIDLTALEQSAALLRPRRSDWVRVELLGPQGQRSGHHGKAAKGRLARLLLERGPEVLDGYVDVEGWVARLV